MYLKRCDASENRKYELNSHFHLFITCTSLGPSSLSAVFCVSTYIFSDERFLLLWVLPFLLRFLFHPFKEESRLRSGRKVTISVVKGIERLVPPRTTDTELLSQGKS